MPLEIVNSNSTPDALNKDWPEGPVDVSLYGAIHLRNIKLVAKNFYNAAKSFVNNYKLNFEGGKAKAALDSEKLAGASPNFFQQVFNWNDDPPVDKLPVANNSGDYGITFISSSTDSLLENRAASTAAVEELYKIGAEHIEGSEYVVWKEVTGWGANGDNNAAPLPSLAKAYLDNGNDIEFAILVVDRAALQSWLNQDNYITIRMVYSAKEWSTGAPGAPTVASNSRPNNIRSNPDGNKVPWIYVAGKDKGGGGIPLLPELIRTVATRVKVTWRPIPKE